MQLNFSEDGEVALKVTADRETTNSVYVRFTVTDGGIGLSEEIQARLFQPFMQADGSTSRKYGGSGLGLSISRKLVELMHGEIGVTSVPGEGSVFWCCIPFEKRPDVTKRPYEKTISRTFASFWLTMILLLSSSCKHIQVPGECEASQPKAAKWLLQNFVKHITWAIHSK